MTSPTSPVTEWAWPTEFCGYTTSTDEVCHVATDNRRCETHEQARYAVCAGCGSDAVRACPRSLSGGGRCDTGLCPNCAHDADGAHKPYAEIRVTAAQQAAQPDLQAEYMHIRQDLGGVVARVLTEQAAAGALSFAEQSGPSDTTNKLLNALATHMLVRHLSGMARMGSGLT